MPMFDFGCKCGTEFALQIPIAAYDEFTKTECPSCGEEVTKKERILSAPRVSVIGVSKGRFNSQDHS